MVEQCPFDISMYSETRIWKTEECKSHLLGNWLIKFMRKKTNLLLTYFQNCLQNIKWTRFFIFNYLMIYFMPFMTTQAGNISLPLPKQILRDTLYFVAYTILICIKLYNFLYVDHRHGPTEYGPDLLTSTMNVVEDRTYEVWQGRIRRIICFYCYHSEVTWVRSIENEVPH